MNKNTPRQDVTLSDIERKISYLVHDLEPAVVSFQGFLNLVKTGRFNTENPHHLKLVESCESAMIFAKEILRTMLETASLNQVGFSNSLAIRTEVTVPVERSLGVLSVIAREKDIHLNTRISPRQMTTCVDDHLIERVLVNLGLNAIKHAPHKSCIDIDIHRKGEEFVIAVGDEGPGIEEADLSRIFDEYRQLDLRQKQIYQGVGLGLAFCRDVCTHLGGTIKAENKDQTGLTIWIRIPDPDETMDKNKNNGNADC